MRISWAITWALLLWCGAALIADEDKKLRKFLKDDGFTDGWIYEDIEAGYQQALKTGKPLLVSFRCVP